MPRTRSLAWSELKIGVMAVAALALTAILVDCRRRRQRLRLGALRPEDQLRQRAGPEERRHRPRRRRRGRQGDRASSSPGTGVEVHPLDQEGEPVARHDAIRVASIGAMSLLGEPLIDVSPASTGTPLKDGDTIKSNRPARSMSDVAETANEGIVEATALLKDIRAGKGTRRQAVHRRSALPRPRTRSSRRPTASRRRSTAARARSAS